MSILCTVCWTLETLRRAVMCMKLPSQSCTWWLNASEWGTLYTGGLLDLCFFQRLWILVCALNSNKKFIENRKKNSKHNFPGAFPLMKLVVMYLQDTQNTGWYSYSDFNKLKKWRNLFIVLFAYSHNSSLISHYR